MIIFDLISLVVWYLVVGAVLGIIFLVVARLVVHYADVNPFSRTAITIRQFSEPLITPIRGILLSYRLDPKLAPFVTILVAILIAWFVLQVVGSVIFTTRGLLMSLQRGAMVSFIGYLLFGVLAVYSLMIIARVILSWGMNYGHPVMRFLIHTTDPILVPFRRIIPRLGMFDISPIVVLIILQLFQSAIAGTLIR